MQRINNLKKLDHIAEIAKSYDTYIIDLWGVMHNGIKLNSSAIQVAENLYRLKKKIVFLSNAPRPSDKVRNFLKNLDMNEKFLKNVITSGEAAMLSINKNEYGKLFFHLGPSRDNSVFYNIKENKTDLKSCDFILCTGLFDEHQTDLEFYEKIDSLSPFGSGNPEPKFVVENLKSINSKIVGDKHIKSILLGSEGSTIKTIAFNATDNELGAYLLKKNNNTFNIAGKLSLNEWRGQKNVEFIIDDISVNKNMKN